MPTRTEKEIEAQSNAVLDTLLTGVRPEVLFRVWEKLGRALPGLNYPIAEASEEDDGALFICPICDTELTRSNLTYADHEVRYAELYREARPERKVWFSTDEGGDMEDIALRCGACGNAIEMPAGWTHDWM